jgi:uncharacterized protein (DUF2345 family)
LESERNSSTVNIFQGDLKKPVIALKTKNNNTDIEIRAEDGDIKFIAGGRIVLDSAKAISLISHKSKIMLKAQEDITIASKDEVVIDGDAIRLN